MQDRLDEIRHRTQSQREELTVERLAALREVLLVTGDEGNIAPIPNTGVVFVTGLNDGETTVDADVWTAFFARGWVSTTCDLMGPWHLTVTGIDRLREHGFQDCLVEDEDLLPEELWDEDE